MSLQTGQELINRYRIVKLLGQGGFGAVYRGWDINLSKACAVKENLETTAQAQRQFTREATVLANLSHPNLPRVTDYFTIEGQGQYLVMDYVEGEDLEEKMARGENITVEQAVDWISQVADALTYLHSRKPLVLHRDIKPANIRITPDGRAMLVDFGLVKVFDPHLRTTMGARAVTPGYAPPEQYGRGGATDVRTDVYALGATLYKLLTRQEPVESVQRIAGKQMPSAGELNPSVPGGVNQAIERAMQLEPGQRYQSGAEFKQALSKPAHSAGAPVVVSPAARAHAHPAAMASSAAQARPVAQAPAPPRKSISGQKRKRSGVNRPLVVFGVLTALVLCLGSMMGLGLWAVGESQISAEKTSEAKVQQTLAERVRVTSTARMAQTATARAAQTATAIYDKAKAQETQAEIAKITSTARALENEIATLEASGQLVFGPISGSLLHEAEDSMIEVDPADVDLEDFIVEARFFNPYATSIGSWDYGFLLRRAGKNESLRLILRSNEKWTMLNKTDDSDAEIVANGTVTNLNLSAGGSNLIKFIAVQDRGYLFINGQFIAELGLSARLNSGEIHVATGIYTGDEITGETTEFEAFKIWAIP